MQRAELAGGAPPLRSHAEKRSTSLWSTVVFALSLMVVLHSVLSLKSVD